MMLIHEDLVLLADIIFDKLNEKNKNCCLYFNFNFIHHLNVFHIKSILLILKEKKCF